MRGSPRATLNEWGARLLSVAGTPRNFGIGPSFEGWIDTSRSKLSAHGFPQAC